VPTAGASPPPAATAPSGEAIVTPIGAEGDASATTPPRRAVALRQPPRAKRPSTVVPTVADTAALFPKSAGTAAGPGARTVSRAAPETVATNAPAKPAPKSKSKAAAWHDPFAD
jgi:hypothetical protein